jgi:predicted metal-dependent hydrolase
LFIDPGGITTLFGPYLEYYRPSFHPWQFDNRGLLDAWKAELEASPFYEQGMTDRASPGWSA